MTMYTIFKGFLTSTAVFLCLVSSSQASSADVIKSGGDDKKEEKKDKKENLLDEAPVLSNVVKSQLAVVALNKLRNGNINGQRRDHITNQHINANNSNSFGKSYFYESSNEETATSLGNFRAYLAHYRMIF